MPLPEGNPVWPPRSVAVAAPLYEEWAAWYSGDPQQLAKVYGQYFSTGALNDPQLNVQPMGAVRGGWVGQVQRKFWGSPPPGGGLTLARLHVPLAGDIAATSADLLFGEELKVHAVADAPAAAGADGQPAPTLGAPATDQATQDRIDLILDDGGAFAVFLEAAEICAAWGGVYLRAGWDMQVADHVLFTAIPPDAAVPEWRSGQLAAVTFWRQLAREDDNNVYRHLERHEVVAGLGVVWHGLYVGTDDRLGQQIPLTEHPETAAFAELVGPGGFVATGARRLAVQYVPNMRPQRHPRLRGSLLGRSDFAGIESTMDALDETWTSWLRDVRLGKGRVVVPDSYLVSRGRGKGAYFDAEREVYETVQALGSPEQGMQLQVVQFNIRVQEHQQTAQALLEQAVRGAGYSVQTFGGQGDVAATATEVVNRERRSVTTRKRKIRYWAPALRNLFTAALEIDALQFGSKITPAPPTIEFPDVAGVDPVQQAQTLQMLRAAEIISMRTAVAELHPDWEQPQIDEEVDRITGEAQAAAAVNVGPPGAGQDTGDQTDQAATDQAATDQQPAGVGA